MSPLYLRVIATGEIPFSRHNQQIFNCGKEKFKDDQNPIHLTPSPLTNMASETVKGSLCSIGITTLPAYKSDYIASIAHSVTIDIKGAACRVLI